MDLEVVGTLFFYLCYKFSYLGEVMMSAALVFLVFLTNLCSSNL